LFGLTSFLPSISLVLFALAGVTIYRMKARDAVPAEAQGAFVAIPDTSVGVAVNLSPEVEWVMDQDEKQSDDPFKDNPYVS
ncbi:MAG: MFS transporter, partial [Candidatus Puniceispirillum sp.]